MQIGVKSFGCEKSTPQESPSHSWKLTGPSLVSAVKSGAMSPIVKLIVSLRSRLSQESAVAGTATRFDIQTDFGNKSDFEGYTAYGQVGTRQDKWYAQISATDDHVDHWDLSNAFTPVAGQPSGKRLLSGTDDWRTNLKVGFTPGDLLMHRFLWSGIAFLPLVLRAAQLARNRKRNC